jgi:hypothetical protein
VEGGVARGPRPSCVPDGGADVPDDAFADTNCDGIDGDALAAVFVSPGGSDEANGVVDAPVKTLTRAIALAVELGKPAVYICAGEYAERLVVTAGIELYGGFDCERGWARVNEVAHLRPPDGVPLTVRDVAAPVRIHRMAFHAADVAALGGSSTAVVVSRATDVAFEHAELIAGSGGKGAPGTNPHRVWEPVTRALHGEDVEVNADCLAEIACTGYSARNPPICQTVPRGGNGGPQACPSDDVVMGGPGGRGGNCGLALYGEAGSAGTGVSSRSGGGASGGRGSAGNAGADFGRVTAGAYVPSVGGSGGWGEPGSGGRGGDGSSSTGTSGDQYKHYTIGGAGGQGGYPGCGGDGGNGGGGGGASIALLMETSGVRLTSTFLITGRGGDGGLPAPGVSGQAGGDGARGSNATGLVPGGAGTRGGDGGQGGMGGPGAGGPSVGIVHTGKAPAFEDTQFEVGEPGMGATGASQAPDGLRANVHEAATGGATQ